MRLVTDPRRKAWEQWVAWPLTAAAVAFLLGWAWPILDPELEPPAVIICSIVTWLAWAVFVADYVIRVLLSDDRWRFVRRHVLDLVVIALPVLRPLQLLRVVTTLTILSRRASTAFRGRVALYVVTGALLVWVCASLAILDVERDRPGANIQTFGDALWWAITTMSTVGYGDRFPVTLQGRLVAAGLMVTGIAVLGVVSASFASWLVQRVYEIESTSGETQDELVSLRAEVERLTRLVADSGASDGSANVAAGDAGPGTHPA